MDQKYSAILKISPTDENLRFPVGYEEVNWGNSRGQGKRSGRMVRGGMADPPRGKRRYIRYLANIPEAITHPEDFNGFQDEMFLRYWQCRNAGGTHEEAICFVFLQER